MNTTTIICIILAFIIVDVTVDYLLIKKMGYSVLGLFRNAWNLLKTRLGFTPSPQVETTIAPTWDEHVTFIYEYGSGFYYNKLPISYGPKWDALNHARIRWNVAQALGVPVADLSLDDAVAYARGDQILSLPCRIRVVDHAVNKAGQAYKRYDMFEISSPVTPSAPAPAQH